MPLPNRSWLWLLLAGGCLLGIALLVGTTQVLGGFWKPVMVMPPSQEQSVEIEVTGRQWEWIIRYPGADAKFGGLKLANRSADNVLGMDVSPEHLASHDDFLSDTLFLPKGIPIFLQVRSEDVLHQVFLPHFRVEITAVPGMETHAKFIATETTAELQVRAQASMKDRQRDSTISPVKVDFELLCNKICGRGHYGMRKVVVVLEREDYAAWHARASKYTLYERLRTFGDRQVRYLLPQGNNTATDRVNLCEWSSHKLDEMERKRLSKQRDKLQPCRGGDVNVFRESNFSI